MREYEERTRQGINSNPFWSSRILLGRELMERQQRQGQAQSAVQLIKEGVTKMEEGWGQSGTPSTSPTHHDANTDMTHKP